MAETFGALQVAVANASDESKRAFVAFLRGIIKSIELPADQLWNIMFYPHQCTVIRIGIGLRAFHTIDKSPNKRATAEDIARKVSRGADALLAARIMRVVAGMGVVKEVGRETYENGPVGQESVKDVLLVGGVKFM
jgi:hypothetical protein